MHRRIKKFIKMDFWNLKSTYNVYTLCYWYLDAEKQPFSQLNILCFWIIPSAMSQKEVWFRANGFEKWHHRFMDWQNRIGNFSIFESNLHYVLLMTEVFQHFSIPRDFGNLWYSSFLRVVFSCLFSLYKFMFRDLENVSFAKMYYACVWRIIVVIIL